MAYDSDDVCPPVETAKASGKKASPGSPHEDPLDQEAQAVELEGASTRQDDNDRCPRQPSPVYVAISRDPDSRAGEKRDYEARPEEAGDVVSYSPFLKLMAWVVGCGIVLWLYFQLTGLIKTALEYSFRYNCHDWQFWIAWAIPVIPVLALLYVAWKFYRLFRRLPVHEQVHGDLLASDVKKKEKLKCLLKPYLAGLQKNKNYVAAAFKSEEDRKKVLKKISKLSKDQDYSDVGGWLDDFRNLQEKQEDRAYEVVKKYCMLVALKTAACPWKSIDMVIVFVNLTLMIEKIALVYNRRISKEGAFRLLCRWFMNIYISGELGAITENVANQTSDKVAEWLTNGKDVTNGLQAADGVQADSLADLFSASLPVFSKVVGKVAEGGVNAYLAYRMGKRAIEEFRFFVPADNGNCDVPK